MANRHHGKLADVWKHLCLVRILQAEEPEVYGETHAGSAGYGPVDDPERRYGVTGFPTHATVSPLLAGSRYREHLARLASGAMGERVCPGSPLLAMLERGRSARYVLCDLDPDSVADIAAWAARLELTEQVRAVEADGISTIRALMSETEAHGLVHIDPYDPHAHEPGGLSALELAAELADDGVTIVHWYGYDAPEERAWAYDALRQASASTPWWCGDVLVTTAGGETRDDGDLGAATTPGTGCGVVCANLSDTSVTSCEQLGRALAAAYAGVELPQGGAGGVSYLRG